MKIPASNEGGANLRLRNLNAKSVVLPRVTAQPGVCRFSLCSVSHQVG